jgi:hypothetical protein
VPPDGRVVDPAVDQPTGSALGDALDGLGRAAAAIVHRLGPIAWALAAIIARGRLLGPLRN